MSWIRRYLFLGIMCFGVAEGAILIHAGPEVYYFQRDKAGGTQQSGTLLGGRFTIERMKPFSIYAGFDAFLGGGDISGISASGRNLYSNITDTILEGRIGYTLASGNEGLSLFTLYTGYGHFQEVNSFEAPSPILYTSTDTFNYALIGFLSGLNFTPMVSIGVNFEVRFMLNGQSKISDDPLYDDVTLTMTNELQARVEIPINFTFPTSRSFFRHRVFGHAQLVPFYEYRHFGGREDFPFDFIDTQFHLVGVKATIGTSF